MRQQHLPRLTCLHRGGFVLVSAGYRLTRDGYVGTDLVEPCQQ